MIPIPQDWYASEDVVELARNLLGKMIISRVGDRFTSGMIVETEAYRAPDDKGSHAYGNRHTKRTATMFGPPGCAYVYLCYGIHHLCNVVTGPPDTAHAVLIRAVEPIEGTEHISHRRSMPQTVYHLTNGPGKWTKALGITTALDGIPYHDPSSPVIICEGKFIANEQIIAGPRVGIAYAKECALWDWRFSIRDSPWVSRPTRVSYPELEDL